MIGVSSGIIELRGRYGVAQLRADAPADLVARLRELLEGADGADGGPGRGAARADGARDGVVRNSDPGPTAPLRADAEAGAWAAAVMYASASTADAPQEAPNASDRVEESPETITWSEEDEARASAATTGVWVPSSEPATPPPSSSSPAYPEPEPGSGRRRRRPGAATPGAASRRPSSPAEPARPPRRPPWADQHRPAPTEVISSGASASGASAPTAGYMTFARSQDAGAMSAPQSVVPLVWASVCAAGHVNPPDAPGCLSCSAPLTGERRQVPLPVLATLVLSTGWSVPVRGEIIIGRAPRARPGCAPGTSLVQVPSPTQTVSRSHLQVTTAGWSVLALDLGSNNGTVLARPGMSPVLLATSLPTPLFVGDLLDVGDGVTLRIDPPL
ncbi:FHA domain-containing protein [Actinomyces dentalis]|uniref:FHA domain-containing protein n=1 Tax=Actinomyces dentalis TaxID=272548 RepID=UPI002355B895|nr:FHA domain-containing protein [Actinomyces dentalis]